MSGHCPISSLAAEPCYVLTHDPVGRCGMPEGTDEVNIDMTLAQAFKRRRTPDADGENNSNPDQAR